ncbi:unnamed protein product [Microthlaspi erraticum]|uniref:Thioredoxin domain-containing protein n=1 Tax=Microthlaspi erraticum TaxID=1685480 RepID=A0A6D2HD56_9BRAS|nr:unnamed protein product [Microthlaspi erraticum]
MEQIWVLSRLAVTVTCVVCLGFSVGMSLESDPLIKTYVSSSLPSNDDPRCYVLVMFTSDKCKDCQFMNCLLNELDWKYTGRMKFYIVDFDKEPVIVERYNVTVLPTTIIFRDGHMESRVNGFYPDMVRLLVHQAAN